MDPKIRIQAMRDFLTQAGARLSAATIATIKSAIETLEGLVGVETPDEDAVEQGFVSAQKIFCQAMVTGISTSDTYEELIWKLSRAVRGDKTLPGDYRYTIFTHQQWVAFEAYSRETYESVGIYIADYFDDGATIAFSNVRDASIQTIIVAIAESEQFAIAEQRKKLCEGSDVSDCRILTDPVGAVMFQSMRNGVICQKREDGRYIIQGIATHGNVVNKCNPPIVFPTALWASELEAVQELIAQGKAVGCLGHPATEDGDYREPTEAEFAMRFTSLVQSGDYFVFEAVTCTSQAGKDFAALIDDGVAFDMSTVARAKTKKEDWMGQSVHVAQPDNFQWIRIADAVLQGASPGAEITDVRLQALNMGPHEEDTMTPEEIKALIDQATATGSADITALQADLKKITDTLEQKKTLTEDQEKVLAQAGEIVARDEAAKVATARDAKVESVVDAMMQGDAKKFEPMFSQSAKSILSSMCQSADDVEDKVPQLLEAMKPMLLQQVTMASKGMYIPEYKGESKIVVNTPGEAIEDLVQTAVKQDKIKDNGRDDPSNMARNARMMLQTLAMEKPAYAVAHMRVRNGDCKSVGDMKTFLQQSYGMLTQDIPVGAMTTDDVATAIPFVLPIVMEMIPQLIAARYASLQPMSKSLGTIAYWKTYGTNAQNADFLVKDVDNFTGSYATDPGEKQAMKRLKGKLTTESISPTAKKLGFDLSIEVIRRLQTDWGIDATAVMVAECAAQIAREWNYNHLAAMVQGQTGGNWTYGSAVPANGLWSGKEWQEQLLSYITFAEAGIGDLCGANAVAVIGSRTSIARVKMVMRQVGDFSDSGFQGQIARGVNIAGAANTGEELVSVDWWDDVVADNKLLIIARGSEWYRSGFVVAPYLGLYVSPPWVDPETLDYEQGMLSEVAEKMVNGNFFGTVTITSAAGTPL